MVNGYLRKFRPAENFAGYQLREGFFCLPRDAQ